MKAINTILVVLDRSDRDKAVLARAQILATRLGAKLELFLCDAEHEYEFRRNLDDRGNAAGRARCAADAMAYLHAVKEMLPLEPSSIQVDARCESPLYEGIVSKVRASRPDLVLKSPSCERPDAAKAFSDNDWMLASTCPRPLMFVGAREWSASPRIGAAVDASSHERPGLASAILEVADLLRARTDGQLEVMACVPDATRDVAQNAYARRFDELVSALGLPGEQVHLLKGDPERVLPEFAVSRAYDVLIMGALAHRVMPAPMVGSLTSKLVNALDCDFLLMKPDAESLPLRHGDGPGVHNAPAA